MRLSTSVAECANRVSQVYERAHRRLQDRTLSGAYMHVSGAEEVAALEAEVERGVDARYMGEGSL